MSVEEGSAPVQRQEGFDHMRCDHCGRQGHHATCQGLACTNQVWTYSGLLVRPKCAGTPAAGHDFVHYNQDLMTPGNCTDGFEISRGMHAHPAGGLDQRFDDKCGDLVAMLT